MPLRPLLIEVPEPVFRWLAREGTKRKLAPQELVAAILVEGFCRFGPLAKKRPRGAHARRGRRAHRGDSNA